MYILNDEKMLPSIFAETKCLFEKISQDLATFKDALLIDKKEENVKQFFAKYSKYQTTGLPIFKNAIGDLCVGLKALGNKFGALGGTSFELLSNTSEQFIASTGDFISYITSYIVSSDALMEANEKNVQEFETLCDNVQKYFDQLAPLFQSLSEGSCHLYGDAKNRLQDRFVSLQPSLVNFIHMVKIKVVSALANVCVGIKIGYDIFAELIDVKLENLYEMEILEQEEVNNDKVKELLKVIIVNFDEALTQAEKMYN